MHTVTILLAGLALIVCNEAASIANDARLYQEGIPNLGVVSPAPNTCMNTELGEFIRLEVSGCTNQPCQTSVGSQEQITATFKPHRSTNHANFRVTYYGLTTDSILYNDLIRDTLVGGQQYTIPVFITIPEVHRGDVVKVLVEVYDSLFEDNYISRCFDMLVSINI